LSLAPTDPANDMSRFDSGRRKWIWFAIACGCYFLATLIVLGEALLSGGSLVLSARGQDLSGQFVGWRFFGFSQLSRGHLALWNPHLFAGTPYLGGFQSALLYPLNWHYAFMPLADAINLGIAMHVFLTGLWMYCWMRFRGLHPVACILSGFVFMFGGAYFLHIYAGHLPNLCTMIWAPLIFLAIDDLTTTRSLRGAWIGAGAVAMQILAGHPQYVFYTAIIAGIYSLLCLWKAPSKWNAIGGFVLICLGGAALSAAQLLTGMQAAGESIRQELGRQMASSFSFAPENLLTLIAPGFFGPIDPNQYWGRWFLWEDCIFIGAAATALALYGAIRGERTHRRFAVTMLIISMLLALGAYTPLYNVIYHLPGIGNFRGISKFIFLALIFSAALSAIGLDRLLRIKTISLRPPIIIGCAGLLLLILAWIINASADSASSGWWGQMMSSINFDGWGHMRDLVRGDAFDVETGHRAAGELAWAGLIFLIAGGFWAAARWKRGFAWGIAALSIIELMIFAGNYTTMFKMADVMTTAETWRSIVKRVGPDVRIYSSAESPMLLVDGYDAWGTDPMVMRRYALYMAFSQDQDPAFLPIYTMRHIASPMFKLPRLKYIFTSDMRVFPEPFEVMKRAQLIGRDKVISDQQQELSALNEPSFDPSKSVILESAPQTALPGKDVTGNVELKDISSDEVQIDATVSAPAILLITDAYSTGWRARALADSAQASYEVVPADYAFRGIPLSAGTHHILMEYRPTAWVIGKWISIAALLIYLALGVIWLMRARKQTPATSVPDSNVKETSQ